MKLAVESGWSRACEERIEALTRGRDRLFPEMAYPERAERDRQYNREIRQWKRRLFWARYGYIRAAVIGISIGAMISTGMYHLLP